MAFPAGYHNVLGIASTNNADARSTFSNFGSTLVSLAGPGEGLVTAYPGGGYATVWGTSFSSPLVSGTVALMLQTHPSSSYQQIEQALRAARRLGPELGAGRLDIQAALAARMAIP
jgi:subtilisin family serine protease